MNLPKDPLDIIAGMPESLRALSVRQGALLPAGAVIYAEGDTRNFHELLFVFHGILHKQKYVPEGTAEALRETLSYYARRFQGWYGLSELADDIDGALKQADFKDPSDLLAQVEKLMIVTGHFNSWIDLLIPWSRINQTLQGEPGEKS